MGQPPKNSHRSNRSLIPAEGNFEEHPYFRVGDRNAGTGVLHYENELRTREGHVLEQSWVVRAATGRGLPGRFDQDVYVALLQLIDERGLPGNGWLSFSIYELVELMGRGHSGRDYQQVRDSLLRLSSTTIESKNAFYHSGKKRYITDSFSLLSEVKLAEYEDPEGHSTDRNAVLLSNYFLESYQANYLKNIDSRFYWSLSSPIAKRLYRLIDKKRGGRKIWEAEIFSLKDRIPLSDYRYASKIKEKLSPAHAELAAQEFLEDVHYRKTNGGEYAVYQISDAYQDRKSLQTDSMSRDETFCFKRLKAEGVSAVAAEDMVFTYGPGRVMQYIEALPYQRNLRNPAGWLRRAVEQSYELDLPPAPSIDANEVDDDSDCAQITQGTLKLHNTSRSEDRAVQDSVCQMGSVSNSPSDVGTEVPKDPVDQRLVDGEFDEVINELSGLDHSEYLSFVSPRTPIVDRAGNRFHLSSQNELYLYIGDHSLNDLHYLCVIDRHSSNFS